MHSRDSAHDHRIREIGLARVIRPQSKYFNRAITNKQSRLIEVFLFPT